MDEFVDRVGDDVQSSLSTRVHTTRPRQQTARILVQEGSQPRYGEGRNEDLRMNTTDEFFGM